MSLHINLSARFTYRKGIEMKLHYHTTDYQVQYVTAGSAITMVNGNVFHIHEGDIIFVHQGESHSFLTGGNGMRTFEIKFCSMDKDIISILDKIPTITPSKIIGTEPGILLDRVIEEGFLQSSGYGTMGNALLEECIVLLMRSNEPGANRKKPFDEVFLKYNASAPVKAANEFITRHIGQNFTLTDLSKGCGYNQDYLYRVIRKEFNLTLVQYVNQTKLKFAQQMILFSELSLSGIALNLGFDNIQNFSKFFHTYAGVSPSEYKKTQGITPCQ